MSKAKLEEAIDRLVRALVETVDAAVAAVVVPADTERVNASKMRMLSVLDEGPRLLSVKEAAALLGVSTTTVYRLAGRREIPFRRIGRSVRFVAAEIQAQRERKV